MIIDIHVVFHSSCSVTPILILVFAFFVIELAVIRINLLFIVICGDVNMYIEECIPSLRQSINMAIIVERHYCKVTGIETLLECSERKRL